MKTYKFLAFDLGATSGRAMLGSLCDGKFNMEEIHRFPNGIMELHGKFYWDINRLYGAMKEALRKCAQEKIYPDSIGIDTWGVDFGFVAADGTILGLPRAYRDPYTEGAPEEYFQIIPKEEVYALTGIQIMNFNSLFQLYRQSRQNFGPLRGAKTMLFMPDLLAYMLTGEKICEYTIASTSQMLNPGTKKFEDKLLEAAGVSPELLPGIVMPGTMVGELCDAVAKETGIGKIPVVAVAGHDTASAVASVPAQNEQFAYLSSGTWSLMGIETEQPIITDETCKLNFTNEGGIDGTTRFLKNITGMWILEQCKKEWEKEGKSYSYADIENMASDSEPFRSFIMPDDPIFANPPCMTKAIKDYCIRTGQSVPESDGQMIRCIYESLVLRYREVLDMLAGIAPFPIKKLHVIGGVTKNRFVSQITANAVGVTVVCGPSEGTAIGNIMVQARAAGLVGDRWEMRRLINSFLSPDVYEPQDTAEWEAAYKKYLSSTSK